MALDWGDSRRANRSALLAFAPARSTAARSTRSATTSTPPQARELASHFLENTGARKGGRLRRVGPVEKRIAKASGIREFRLAVNAYRDAERFVHFSQRSVRRDAVPERKRNAQSV